MEATVREGTQTPAKFGRTCFTRVFPGTVTWRSKSYAGREVSAYAVFEDDRWLVITVIVRFLR